MNSKSFGKYELNKLNTVTAATLPGSRFAAIALAVLMASVLISCCVSCLLPQPSVRPANASATQPKSDSKSSAGVNLQPVTVRTSQSNENNSKSGGESLIYTTFSCAIVIFTPLVAIAIFALRYKFNADYVSLNTINLIYDEDLKYSRFTEMADILDELTKEGALLEIAKIDGALRHCGRSNFYQRIPKFLTCNADVYCLVNGADRYFFLPDCALQFIGNKFYRISASKMIIAANCISGNFYIERQRSVMVHGRIRKDGGHDQRYNTRFGNVPYDSLESLGKYGVIKIILSEERIILLTDEKTLASDFESAFVNWKREAV